VVKYVDLVRELCNNIPIVVCANKVDIVEKGKSYSRPKLSYDNVWEVIISAKSNYNYEKPFLWLARKLNNDPYLEFIVLPAIHPLEVFVDQQLVSSC